MPAQRVILKWAFSPKDALGPSVAAANAAEIIRYYLGILTRRPELDGFENWTGELVQSHCSGKDCDQILQGIADYFVESPEFSTRFGSNLSTQDFIMLLYKNVLGQSPSAVEAQKWQSDLDARRLTRGQMPRTLTNSAEFVTRTRRQEAGGRRQAAGGRRQAAGGRRQEAGGRRQ